MKELGAKRIMGLPDARSFCCCLAVETGAKIIAWIQLICGLGLFIYCFKYLIILLLDYKHFRGADVIIVIFLFALSLYPLVQGTLLMIGINKKKPDCLLIWMVLAFIVEFGFTSFVVLYVASVLTISKLWFWMTAFVYCNAIQIGISFYFIVIVSTCRKDIISRNSSSGLYSIFHTV